MFLRLWRATGAKPISLNSACNSSGLGWAYSTNSKPSVPIGLSALMVAAGASCGNGPMAESPCFVALSFRHILRKVHAKESRFGYDDAQLVHRMGLLRMIPVDAFD